MVNLSVYKFTLLNNAKEQQVLSFYNEEEDLLDTMNDFCEYIHKNVRDLHFEKHTFSTKHIPQIDTIQTTN